MVKQKKPVHKVQMTEGKRNIIHQLLEEYDIKTAEDIQICFAYQASTGTSVYAETSPSFVSPSARLVKAINSALLTESFGR